MLLLPCIIDRLRSGVVLGLVFWLLVDGFAKLLVRSSARPSKMSFCFYSSGVRTTGLLLRGLCSYDC